jgi:hypothetical protein
MPDSLVKPTSNYNRLMSDVMQRLHSSHQYRSLGAGISKSAKEHALLTVNPGNPKVAVAGSGERGPKADGKHIAG